MAGTRQVSLCDPPKVGPLARSGWDRGAHRWVVSLTAEGRRLVEDYLREFPDPANVLATAAPNLAAVVNRIDPDEAQQAARYGVVKAATMFDPARGIKFGYYVSLHVRNEVQQAFGKRCKGKARREFSDPDAGFGLECREGPPDAGELREVVREAIRTARLSPHERRAVLLYFGLSGRKPGLSQTEVGKRLGGVCKMTVSNAITRALVKFRDRSRPVFAAAGLCP